MTLSNGTKPNLIETKAAKPNEGARLVRRGVFRVSASFFRSEAPGLAPPESKAAVTPSRREIPSQYAPAPDVCL